MSFDYLVAIDFECTCFMTYADENHKIIEFAAAVVCLESGEILTEFREFVRQNVNLTQRCTKFTGVRQADISNANSLYQVIENFDAWLKRNQFHPSMYSDCAFVTWTDNDLGVYLPRNCWEAQIPRPRYFNSWINLALYTGKTSLKRAVHKYGLEFIGKPHRALDDAKNTAWLADELDGLVDLEITSSYP